jgi:hypothetical protein
MPLTSGIAVGNNELSVLASKVLRVVNDLIEQTRKTNGIVSRTRAIND